MRLIREGGQGDSVREEKNTYKGKYQAVNCLGKRNRGNESSLILIELRN